MQCPPALAAHSFLAVSALSVQAHMDVVIHGRECPSSCFFVTIAESGERKTAIDKIAMAPVIKQEEKLRDEREKKMADYNIKMAVRKKSEKAALSSDDPVRALEALGPVPVHPLDASLTTEEPTYEGLVKMLENGQPSVGLFSGEGGRFLGGHAMNRDNQQKSAAGLSSLWDGAPVTRTRVKDSVTLYGKRVSLHLMIQPIIAEQILGSDLLIGQGLMSRILIAYPESTIGNREYSGVNLKVESKALKKFNTVIGKILSQPLTIKTGTTNELVPEIIGLTDEAMERWIVFHNNVEADMKEGRQFCSIRGFAAKAAEHVLRLACVLTAVNDPDEADEIPIEWIESAIRIVEYYLSETLRLFNVSQVNPDLKIAQECLDWLREKYPRFSLIELYRLGPNKVRVKEKAAKYVKILVEHGLVRPIPGGTTIDCNKRRTAWEVVG